MLLVLAYQSIVVVLLGALIDLLFEPDEAHTLLIDRTVALYHAPPFSGHAANFDYVTDLISRIYFNM